MNGPVLLAACLAASGTVAGCGGGAAAHGSGKPCDPLGQVRDQLIVTVGNARTWGPVFRGEHRYPGYANSDRLAVCLLPDGTVEGIFLKDGHRQVLWHQSPADRISFPI